MVPQRFSRCGTQAIKTGQRPFFNSLQNAVTFVLLCSTKVLASLASILA
jgi:hypothetical protein